jgi:adenylylsulfate kinase
MQVGVYPESRPRIKPNCNTFRSGQVATGIHPACHWQGGGTQSGELAPSHGTDLKQCPISRILGILQLPENFVPIESLENMRTDDHVQVHWHQHAVSREEREKLNGHAGCVVWFTGLSACGKSTVANLLDHQLHSLGMRSFVLDGDNVRHGLNAAPAMLKERHGDEFAKRFGLGFSAQDREENIRRIGAVAKLFSDAGVIAITAFISPYRVDRDRVRASLADGDFVEIFVDAPIEVCEKRDPKGLYKKARAGELRGFTGIDDPYEAPLRPELHLDAGSKAPEELADEVLAYLAATGKIPVKV